MDLEAPLYKSKGERTDCKNYRGISFISVVGKIYAGILVDRVRRVTEGLIDDVQGWFSSVRGYVNQIFCLLYLSEKARKKKKSMYVSYVDFQKAYDGVCRKAL